MINEYFHSLLFIPYVLQDFEDYRDADDAVYDLNGKDLMGERSVSTHLSDFLFEIESLKLISLCLLLSNPLNPVTLIYLNFQSDYRTCKGYRKRPWWSFHWCWTDKEAKSFRAVSVLDLS